MDDKMTMIVAATVAHVIDTEAPLKDRLNAAMKEAADHWLVTDENIQFAGAIIAVMKTASEDEQTQIKDEMRVLNSLSAAMSGVPVNMGAALESIDPDQIIGLQGLWKEAKTTQAGGEA